MAKQRPSLGVFASPVSNFVAPIDPQKTVAPVDQQSIQNAYAFADAFSQLSVTAAKFAATIKTEQNEEAFKAGQDLVNQNRKTYSQLVQEGQIKPSENPWLAVGAQEASGIIEASTARNEFKMEYEARVAEDPSLLDDTKFFDSLASSYAAKKNAEFGDSQYLSRSFYANFNPYMIELQSKNADAVGERRIAKVMEGVSSSVDMALQDAMSVAVTSAMDIPYPDTGTLQQKKNWIDAGPRRSRETYIDSVVLPRLQGALDEAGKNSGFPEITNKAAIQNLVERMKTSDNPEVAERLLSKIRGGTGLLKDTDFARQALAASENQIRSNFERMTHEDSKEMTDLARDLADRIFNGDITPAQAEEQFRAAATRKISANEVESKIPFMNGLVAQRRAAMAEAVKQAAERDAAFTSAFIERSKAAVEDQLGRMTQTAVDRVSTGSSTLEERSVMADEYRKFLLKSSLVVDDQGKPVLKRQYDKEGNVIGEIPAENFSIIEISEKLDKFNAALDNTNKRSLDRNTQNAVDAVRKSIADEITSKGGVFNINFNTAEATFNARMNEAGISADNVRAAESRKQLVIASKQAFENATINAAKALNVPNLMPDPNDSLDVRTAKSKARAMIALNKVAFATAFNDAEYISEFRNSVRSLVTYNLEGGVPWQVEDMVYLYESARNRMIDMDVLFGTGENAKAYKDFFERVSNFRMNAGRMPMPEAVKRAGASLQLVGVDANGMVDIGTKAGDVVAFTESMSTVLQEWQEAPEKELHWWFANTKPTPLNYESVGLARSMFRDEYMKALRETAHPDTALERAQEAVRTKLQKTGGSLVPSEDLAGIGPSNFKILAEVASSIKPSEFRGDGTIKSTGWLGIQTNAKGEEVTEYTIGVEINGKQMDIPVLVPGLSQEEINAVLKASETQDFPPIGVVEKAISHAESMVSKGKGVFAPDIYSRPVREDASFTLVGTDNLGESVYALRGEDGMSIVDKVFKISEIRAMMQQGVATQRIDNLLRSIEPEKEEIRKKARKLDVGRKPPF